MGYPVVVTEPTGEGMETIVESISGIDTAGIITALEGIKDAIGGGSTGSVEIVVKNGVVTGYSFSAVIPDGVTSIGDYAFQGSGVKQITLPDGVTSIGSGAFFSCFSLAQITLPDGVKSIGVGAFRECTSLAQITLPDGVKSIGAGVFSGINANAVIDCGFAEGAVTGAPWGAPDTVTINYGVTPNN